MRESSLSRHSLGLGILLVLQTLDMATPETICETAYLQFTNRISAMECEEEMTANASIRYECLDTPTIDTTTGVAAVSAVIPELNTNLLCDALVNDIDGRLTQWTCTTFSEDYDYTEFRSLAAAAPIECEDSNERPWFYYQSATTSGETIEGECGEPLSAGISEAFKATSNFNLEAAWNVTYQREFVEDTVCVETPPPAEQPAPIEPPPPPPPPQMEPTPAPVPAADAAPGGTPTEAVANGTPLPGNEPSDDSGARSTTIRLVYSVLVGLVAVSVVWNGP